MKITIFTIPKPFEGHIGVIQKNAIQSWINLDPRPDVILFGDEVGVKEAAEEFNVTYFPLIRKNRNGTPYINTVFALAQVTAKTQVLCYSNCDDMFFQNLIDTISAIPESMKDRFLLLGERWNVDITTPVNSKDEHLVRFILLTKKIQKFPGLDYFVFPKNTILEMPDFLVGRAGWDNWVIYNARRNNIRVFDASSVVTTLHQNHDYSHVPQQKGDMWKGSSESKANLKLVKNRYIYLWELADSDWTFEGGLHKRPYSYRTLAQDIVLSTPEWMHLFIEPVFRAGHILRWGYLQIKG